jgi:energy-converting hydrogenase Eha subunit E
MRADVRRPLAMMARKGRVKVFLFFSSRLGCLGSIAVSVVVTLILLAVYHVI